MKDFDSINKELLEDRLPNAFDKALLVSKKAESVIYMAIVKSLEQLSDVAICFDVDDPICSFLDKWNDEGYIGGALSFSDVHDGKKQLSCRFDLYEIRDTFDVLSEDLFGTISSEYSRKLDDSGLVSIASGDVMSLEKGFQKIKLDKKDN